MSTETKPTTFLPYHEPGIVTILIQSSLLLVLNVVNTVFDQLIFCGLLGQVFVGVAWGTPGAKWLDGEAERVVVQLGYLGLILLVYEGGLETNFRSLKANLFLSVAVALTGISFPMALSFILQYLVNATPLQAFAAGAALCSTSLGTTFTILSTSGLSNTRLGTVLSSAAMMDDVVGLVMVQVISNLGESVDAFSAVTVVRPLAVSLGMAVAVPLACRLLVLPVTAMLNEVRTTSPKGVVDRICMGVYTAFIVHTLILLGLVTGATYAGTSNLFAAYLAGASISWWDSEVSHVGAASKVSTSGAPTQELSPSTESSTPSPASGDGITSSPDRTASEAHNDEEYHADASSGAAVYHKYYKTAVQRILKPFFFASIGFAIPITDMFTGDIVWRGIVYTILMLFGKLVTGFWLVRINVSWPKVHIPEAVRSRFRRSAACIGWPRGGQNKSKTAEAKTLDGQRQAQVQESVSKDTNDGMLQPAQGTSSDSPPSEGSPSPETTNSFATQASPSPKISKPLSLYPAAMLGTAMTARGEIGFLIASLAETTGLFATSSGEPSSGSSEIYLVVTWAIVLCTVIGPLGIGTLVKRVRRLQGERREGKSDRVDPLGIWGVG